MQNIEVFNESAHVGEDYLIFDEALRAHVWDMEDRHFWFRARNAWILDYLRTLGLPSGASLLEVGCGSGAVARALQDAGFRVTGIDTAGDLVQKAAARVPEGRFLLGRLEDVPSQRLGHFDAVAFFDVLEHLPDPRQLMTLAMKFIRDDGFLVMTVPARRSLMSEVDVVSGHKRRYEPGEATSLLLDCGLRDVEERGIFISTAALQNVVRKSPQIRPLADISASERRSIIWEAARVPAFPVNFALYAACTLERRLAHFVRLPEGRSASIIAAGRKLCRANRAAFFPGSCVPGEKS